MAAPSLIAVAFIVFIAVAFIVFIIVLTFRSSSEKYERFESPDTDGKLLTGNDVAWECLPEEFVIFDLETTGLISNTVPVDIIEISAIKVVRDELRAGKICETFDFLVKPSHGGLNARTTEVNKITQSMIDKEGKNIKEVLPQFIEFVGDRLLISYNVDFDRWFIRRELKEQGINKKFEYDCAYMLAQQAFPKMPNYKLTTVASMLGKDTSGAHRALADCVLALHVYIWAKTFTKDGGDMFDTMLPFEAVKKPEFIGLGIAFTGTFRVVTRDQAERLAKKAGMTVKTAISKKVDYLVAGGKPGNNFQKANVLGIKVISEGDFIEMVT